MTTMKTLQFEWTVERCAELRRLVDEAHSYGVIGASLGCSRNAAIGKALRLGLCKKTSPRITVPRPPRRPRGHDGGVASNLSARRGQNFAGTAEEPAMAPDVFDQAIPITQRCSLLELRPDDCRWPVGTPGAPDFFFCGAAAEPGSSYCGEHLARSIDRKPRRQGYFVIGEKRRAA